MKTKLKYITTLTISMLLVVIIIGVIPVRAIKPGPIKTKIMAKGISHWPPSTEVSIIAEIRMGDPLLAEVEFHHKRYDEAGEKVWSLKGKLSNGIVEEWPEWFDLMTGINFINLWYVGGFGKAKYINGEYFEAYIGMIVSPYGDYSWIDETGEVQYGNTGNGWAWAAIIVGGVEPNWIWDGSSTNITMYKEIVP